MFIQGENHGWRGKIGLVSPAGDWCGAPEYYPLLPEGINLDVTTLGVSKLVKEDIEKVINLYMPAAKHLEGQHCNVIVLAGSVVFSYTGYEESQKLIQKIRDSVKVPLISNLEAQFESLRAFKAKKIVLITPYEEARNLERKKLCEKLGFEVVNMKGMGIQKRIDIERLPSYTSYKLAKEAIDETPEADAIYISCPEWPHVRNLAKLELDTGKPVVSPIPVIVWSALRAMRIHEPMKGFGRLMEMV